MLAQTVRDMVRYPVIWAGGVTFAAFAAVVLVLSLEGETFFAPRLLVLVYLILPFLIAGAYGVLRDGDPSPRHYISEGVANYFRVLLPALVVAFAAAVVAVLLLVPLSLVAGTAASGLATVAVFGVLVPVVLLLSLYDTAACFEGLGVFASLRRSASLALAHPWEVAAFVIATLAVLTATGFALLVAWTTLLLGRLEPLTTMTPDEVSALTREQLASMLGAGGIALTALCAGLFILVGFLFVTILKARVFRTVAEATPVVEQGEYDEKGRWYRY